VFVDFSSLRSFCAPRHTPKVALYTREPVQALGFPNTNCVFCSVARVLHMDNVSRRSCVASKFTKYIPVVRNQTTMKNLLQKSSCNNYLLFYIKCSYLLFMFSKQMFTCKTRKTSGCVREELDLEAKRFRMLKW
jgi:hypothetical protein